MYYFALLIIRFLETTESYTSHQYILLPPRLMAEVYASRAQISLAIERQVTRYISGFLQPVYLLVYLNGYTSIRPQRILNKHSSQTGSQKTSRTAIPLIRPVIARAILSGGLANLGRRPWRAWRRATPHAPVRHGEHAEELCMGIYFFSSSLVSCPPFDFFFFLFILHLSLLVSKSGKQISTSPHRIFPNHHHITTTRPPQQKCQSTPAGPSLSPPSHCKPTSSPLPHTLLPRSPLPNQPSCPPPPPQPTTSLPTPSASSPFASPPVSERPD